MKEGGRKGRKGSERASEDGGFADQMTKGARRRGKEENGAKWRNRRARTHGRTERRLVVGFRVSLAQDGRAICMGKPGTAAQHRQAARRQASYFHEEAARELDRQTGNWYAKKARERERESSVEKG